MVERYKFIDIIKHEQDREYVDADDYAALQTVANHYKGEVDRLEAECARLNALANIRLTVIEAREAENARLIAIVGRLAYDPIE